MRTLLDHKIIFLKKYKKYINFYGKKSKYIYIIKSKYILLEKIKNYIV